MIKKFKRKYYRSVWIFFGFILLLQQEIYEGKSLNNRNLNIKFNEKINKNSLQLPSYNNSSSFLNPKNYSKTNFNCTERNMKIHKDENSSSLIQNININNNTDNNFTSMRFPKGFLNIFDIIVFNNSRCNADISEQINGTCYSESECQKLSGTAMGSCADGIGVCCVFKYYCGSISTESVSYFQNFEYPFPSSGPIVCTFTIAINKDTKQILLDFLTFELQPPTNGDCKEDEFLVSGQNRNFIVPPLCGINTDQHIFIDVDQSPTKAFHMSIFGKSSNERCFNIKATQLQQRVTPRGCLQYFSGIHGVIKSFNYDEIGEIVDLRGGSYFNNLNYAICIEREENMCSISYTNEIDNEISEFNIVNMDTYKSEPTIFDCPDDFLIVNGFRLCGEKLNGHETLRSKSMYELENSTLITDYGNGPIVLSFRSDNMYVGRGFYITFEQNYCDSKYLSINHNLG